MRQIPEGYVDKESFATGFRVGYEHVIEVIDKAVEKPSHLNPHVRRVINQAFIILSEALKDQLPTILERINA